MLINFNKDLAIGRVGEEIVYNALLSLGYNVENVAQDEECYYKGDLMVKTQQEEIYIDVKLDNVVAKYGNFFCEEKKYFKDGGYYSIGDMHKNYQVMAIVCPQWNKIYFLDFKVLKQIYKKGREVEKDYTDETTYGYALPIHIARNHNAILGSIKY